MRNYIGITVHFISNEMQQNVMRCACRRSKGHHTAV